MSATTLGAHVSGLGGAEDHLDFTTRLLERADFDDVSLAALREHCASIRARLDDRCFYLAVVGEFSSGKSSFINALLHDRLLPTSALVTTAAPTWIRAADTLKVELFDRRGAHLADGRCASATIWGKDGSVVASPRERLQMARASSSCGSALGRIDVGLPSEALDDGLVIIDTPGFNATDADHGDLSAQVLRECADVAVVIVPADAAVSQALADHLKQAVDRRALDRLLFVVTKLANIDDGEHERLLRVITQRLRSMLGVAQPWVVACSLRGVMRAIDGEALGPDDERWIASFEEVRGRLRSELVRRRVVAVADRTLALLDDTMNLLDTRLHQRMAELEDGQKLLEAQKITDLDVFLRAHGAEASTRLNQRARDLRRQLDDRIEAATRSIRTTMTKTLAAATSVQQIKSFVDGPFEKEARKEFEAVATKAASLAATLVDDTQAASTAVHAAFEAQYSSLRSLSRSIHIGGGVNLPVTGAVDISAGAASSTVALAIKSESHREAGGAIGGAAIGTLVLPGIGTVVGFLVGRLLGGLFGPSVERVRAQAEAELGKAIDAFAASNRELIVASFSRTQTACEQALRQLRSDYKARYEATVDGLLADHRHAVEEVRERRVALRVDLEEVNRRKSLIAGQRMNIERMSDATKKGS